MDIQASFEAQITIQYEEDDVERPLKLKVPKLGSRVEFRVPREVSKNIANHILFVILKNIYFLMSRKLL